jgi:hypothetical protein
MAPSHRRQQEILERGDIFFLFRRCPEIDDDFELPTQNEDDAHEENIRDLRMLKSRHPVKPLFEGRRP